jgi:glycosyltransferase involved in cell wall biosynthesis
VVAPVAVLPERVIDGVTGFVRGDDASFAEAALSIANDDQLWRRQHEAALKFQQGLSWSEVAVRFEEALLSDMIPLRHEHA